MTNQSLTKSTVSLQSDSWIQTRWWETRQIRVDNTEKVNKSQAGTTMVNLDPSTCRSIAFVKPAWTNTRKATWLCSQPDRLKSKLYQSLRSGRADRKLNLTWSGCTTESSCSRLKKREPIRSSKIPRARSSRSLNLALPTSNSNASLNAPARKSLNASSKTSANGCKPVSATSLQQSATQLDQHLPKLKLSALMVSH